MTIDPTRVRFVTVAEATRKFGDMALLWAWSIRRRAGVLANARVTVVFNERADEGLSRRLHEESDVEVVVLDRLSRTHLEQNKFNAFRLPDSADFDRVILTDADMAVCRDLDPLAAWLAEDWDIGVTPAGIRPDPKLPLLRGLDRLLVRYGGIPRSDLAKWEHPWFIDHAPYSRWPYLSGGLFVLRGRHVSEFGERVLEVTRRMNAEMQPVQRNVLRMLRNRWNRLVHARHRRTDPLIIGSWFLPRLADQAAIAAVMVAMDLKPRYLDHAYNWRYEGSGHGDESVRILHYYTSLAREAQQDLIEGDWDRAYADDPNPGRRALAEVVAAYRGEVGAAASFPRDR